MLKHNHSSKSSKVRKYDIEHIRDIEAKWRKIWSDKKTYRTPDPSSKDKTFYCLDMFPYPSGDGLHVGHPVGFITSDIIARFKRMKGFNVLHPMGWDAFGLPAERHAMKTGMHPAETVAKNSENYRRQMDLIGLSFDWDRAFSTTDPDYYKFTQEMFIDLYEAWFNPDTQKTEHISTLLIPDEVQVKGPKAVQNYQNSYRLAYYDDAMVNYCPELGTVVANEEVMHDGRTEQGYEVVRKMQRQVMMRINSFAERLISGLEDLDWPEPIKEMQRNWIGRSSGYKIAFLTETGEKISVYTTRADTLPGTTFLALAPEHKLVDKITTIEHREAVNNYVRSSLQKSELSRKQSSKKTGIRTGASAINPLTGKRIPIFVSNYVLMESGTGAVMGVPAHDTRDFDFARTVDIPIAPVIAPEGDSYKSVADGDQVWTGSGKALEFDLDCYKKLGLTGLPSDEFSQKLCSYLCQNGIAESSTQYRIRDWIFSRQRYWGEPIPLIHWDDGSIEPVSKTDLPLELPLLENYQPQSDGEPPLARATQWVNVDDPVMALQGKRETLTMPQWAGSCWYPLGFMDPGNEDLAVDPALEKRWGAVDLYIGGAEHATLHLLYSRFWYMALSDLGKIKTKEPFKRLVNQGLLLSFTFRNTRGVLIPTDEVETRDDGKFYIKSNSPHYDLQQADAPLERVKAKMSKSLRNIVTPDQVVEKYGADAYRICLMFMGPVEQVREWESSKTAAAQKFLRRFLRFITHDSSMGIRQTVVKKEESINVQRTVEEAVSTIEEGIETLRLNTAIATMMKCLNDISSQPVSRETLEKLILCFSPFAPFMCEELWQRCGNDGSVALSRWPQIDLSQYEGPQTVSMIVTLNGKKRAEVEVPTICDDSKLSSIAKETLSGQVNIGSGELRTIIVRDKVNNNPKLVNVTIK
ncbi:leucine--tRNA ligase [Pseudovibrio sp. Ad26]|uniref:leucine--tRNA ligase n=1 Tax=Pseudovibrio sp. Ad26 TaxID=989410 RepID=UPI0007B18012|nr:leucine--tRNA ligase [Pseudovibrio sp. Ad26]KZL05063.1 Leucine--tRNA ligase [Pseudovibrio sp. Ad26]